MMSDVWVIDELEQTEQEGIIPNNQTVTVYSAATKFQTFVSEEVTDKQLNIQLPIQEIFE